jgi:phosphonate transport system ATP-binding protein
VVMDSLADINAREGITVITNLHTLDTARTYCTRVIGMAKGAVVFDGAPEALTSETVRRIYGAEGAADALSEAITSTSIETPVRPLGEKPRRLEPAPLAG